MRVLVSANVGLNLNDGSSIWVQSIAEIRAPDVALRLARGSLRQRLWAYLLENPPLDMGADRSQMGELVEKAGGLIVQTVAPVSSMTWMTVSSFETSRAAYWGMAALRCR